MYFDLVVAINQLATLAEDLSCSKFESDATGNLNQYLPKKIDDRDLDFKMDGLYVVKYPQDFK